MLRCLQSPENFISNGGGTDMTVLERLRERLLCLQQLQQQQQQQQLQISYYQQQQQQQHQPQQNHGIQNNSLELYQKPLFDRLDNNDFGSFMLARTDKMGFSSPEEMIVTTNSSSEEMGGNSFSRRPCSFPPVATKTFNMEKAKVNPTMGRDNLKKRKAEIGVTDDYCKEKRIKEDAGETESLKVTEKTNKGSSTTTTTTTTITTKNNSKASDVQNQDYIHVRARRGQATDNHSLAERARREKIGKKMKCLQELVPGCNKISGKAGMLDEIINYVQSLQGQVEFLSMKLAAYNPRLLDFNNGNFFAKEFPACAANFPGAAVCSPQMANLASLQFNAMQQGAQSCVLDMQMNPKQLPPHKTTTATSSSVSVPEMYLEQTSSITQVQPFSAWDTDDLQNLYNVEFQ